MVYVLSDDNISGKFKMTDWEKVRDLIIEGMRSNRPAEGIVKAISLCGELLSSHFPVQPGDIDELSNELRLID